MPRFKYKAKALDGRTVEAVAEAPDDVVLCPEVAARQARDAGHSTMEELLLLTTHGILHLLGFDHAEPEEEREMFALQRQLLLTFLSGR